MSLPVPEMYAIEVYNQCRFALQAHTAAHSALDRFGKGPVDTFGPGRRYQREVFRNLHSLLRHAGHVATLLWPPATAEECARERAGQLREHLGLGEAGPLREGVGGVVEADPYGERVNRWLVDRGSGPAYLDHIAAPRERPENLRAGQRMRTFDPGRKELVLWGERVRIDEVVRTIEQVCLRIEDALRSVDGVRLRHTPVSERER